MDHPELENLWQTQGRERSRLAIARYIDQRASVGQLRQVPNIRLAARIVIETVATWAVHIHWDKAPEEFGHEESRSNCSLGSSVAQSRYAAHCRMQGSPSRSQATGVNTSFCLVRFIP